MVVAREFEQPEQIDNLVIPPVADVGPGISRFENFPVDAVPGNTIRIVTVGSRGVDEFGNETFDVSRERKGKSFPVLENVTPVALVVQVLRPIGVFEIDGEVIPGSAGVTMPTAECQRQILIYKPGERFIPAVLSQLQRRIQCQRAVEVEQGGFDTFT